MERDVRIPVRDGGFVVADVYRPAGPGPFPALYAVSPYGKDNVDLPAIPAFRHRETGDIAFYVAHGYAYVHADTRGTGHSTFGEWKVLAKAAPAPENQAAFDFVVQVLRHPSYDEFWRERTAVDRLADSYIPVYSIRTGTRPACTCAGTSTATNRYAAPRSCSSTAGRSATATPPSSSSTIRASTSTSWAGSTSGSRESTPESSTNPPSASPSGRRALTGLPGTGPCQARPCARCT